MIRYIGDFPRFFIERAEGAYIFDDRGRRILDFTSGQMCATLGHNHPEVVAAIQRSCERAIHLFSWLLAPEVVELCRELAALLPPQLQKVILLEHRQRGQRGGAAHGQARDRRPRGGGAQRLVPRPDRRRGRGDLLGRPAAATGPALPGSIAIPAPNAYRCPIRHCAGTCDLACLEVGFEQVDQPAHGRARRGDRRADHQHGRRDRAAGGLLPAPEGAVRGARHAPDPGRGADRVRPRRRQLLLRAGRRGAGFPGGLQDARRRHPARRRGHQRRDRGDLLPAAASCTSPRTSPIRCRRRSASRCSRCCARERLAERALVLGARLEAGLRELQQRYEVIGDVRGRGLLWGVELVRDRHSRKPASPRSAPRSRGAAWSSACR